MQTAEPSAGENVPATQNKQSLSVSWAGIEIPGSLKYLPAAQREHWPVPGNVAYAPTGHAKHWLNDKCDEANFASSDRYVPVGHKVQLAWRAAALAASPLKEPAWQTEQSAAASCREDALAASALKVPAGHIVQSVRASWKAAEIAVSAL